MFPSHSEPRPLQNEPRDRNHNYHRDSYGNSRLDNPQSQQDEQESKRLFEEIMQKATYGFTSSEKKLNELQDGEFRNFDFKNFFSESVQSYEEAQQKKKTLLIALYLARSKGGDKKSRQNLLEHFKESTEESKSCNAQLSLCSGSLFNPKHMTILRKMHKAYYYQILKDEIKQLLGAWHNVNSLVKGSFYKKQKTSSLFGGPPNGYYDTFRNQPGPPQRGRQYQGRGPPPGYMGPRGRRPGGPPPRGPPPNYSGNLFGNSNPLGERPARQRETYDQVKLPSFTKNKVFTLDLQLLSLREILVQVAEDDSSGERDEDLKNLSLRLLTRIGILTKNAETLLMASYLQKKHQVDISQELGQILDEKELFIKPEKEINEKDLVPMEQQILQEKVKMVDNTVEYSTSMTMSYDAFASDKDYFYNYSELRGLTKAEKGRNGNWKKIVMVNQDCKNLKGVSLLSFKNMLLLRHMDQPKSVAFVQYDKETLQPSETIIFKHIDDKEAELERLDWSQHKIRIEQQSEEIQEEQKDEEGRSILWRKIGATPLATDGTLIYALSMQVKQEEEAGQDETKIFCKKIVLEVYEIETNIVKKVRQIVLMNDLDNEWLEPQDDFNRYSTDCGYLNHVQSACNGSIFLLNSPSKTFFFHSETGILIAETSKDRAFKELFQLVYTLDTNEFSAFQTNSFQGFQLKITIPGFKKIQTQEEIENSQAPIVLLDGKKQIQKEISERNKDKNEPQKMNMYEQLIRGSVDWNQVSQWSESNISQVKVSSIGEEIHDLSQAIILTTMATKGDIFDVDLDKLGQNTLDGSQQVAFFRQNDCIYLTKTMFEYLGIVSLDLIKQQTTKDSVSLYSLASLSSIIRLIKTNLRSLAFCRINLKEILTQKEQAIFDEMSRKFNSDFVTDLKNAVQEKVAQEVDNHGQNNQIHKYVRILIDQVRDLEKVLNKVQNSTDPSARMIDLADNLSYSIDNNDKAAMRTCYLTFEALTNDQSMGEILRSSKNDEEFQSFERVVNFCIDLTLQRDIRAFTLDSASEDKEKLESFASSFLKCYVRQHCSIYADLLSEIEDTEIQKHEQDILENQQNQSEEAKQKQKETQKKQTRYILAKQRLEKLESPLYSTFRKICKSYGKQLDFITEYLREKSNLEAFIFAEELDNVTVSLDGEKCLLKSVKLLLWYFSFIDIVESNLVDIADRLKQVIEASSNFQNFIEGLDSTHLWKAKQSAAYINIVKQTMREACYTLGLVAKLLIANDSNQNHAEERKNEQLNFGKLILLQGGIEERFIPELSDQTKNLMQGFFRTTQDKQMNKLVLMNAREVERLDEDKLLERIIQKSEDPNDVSIDGIDYVEQTIQILQHITSTRKRGILMRVGGQDGMCLTRAAFSVIIKFSGQISIFQQVCESIEMAGMQIESHEGDEARTNKIVELLAQDQNNYLLEILCKLWEQASQIRKWTQEMKKDLTEAYKQESMDDIVAEINLELKYTKKQKSLQDDREQELQEEENKESRQDEESDKDKFSENEDESLNQNLEEDDYLFNGRFTWDQLKEIEERAYNKMLIKMREEIKDAIQKAQFLLKMKIPQMYQKTQEAEGLKRKLSRKNSVKVQFEKQDSGINGKDITLKRRQSQDITGNSLISKETSSDWQIRLRQWSQVQITLGQITSFSQLEEAAFKSIPRSIISLLQAKFSLKKLKEKTEKVMLKGFRRLTGLNLLSFATQLNVNNETFCDLVQWLLKSLRQKESQVAHYSDNIEGCGESVLTEIRIEFFKIINMILVRIKTNRDNDTLIYLLNSLIWNYQGNDLNMLSEFNIIEVIKVGDGDPTHPISLNWGKQIKQTTQSKDKTLTRTIVNLFEFLFKQILSQVISLDTQGDDQFNSAKLAKKQYDQVSFSIQQKLIDEVFTVVFQNLQRFIKILDYYTTSGIGPQTVFQNLNNLHPETVEQNESDRLADDKSYIDSIGGEELFVKSFDRISIKNILKFNKVCWKVKNTDGYSKMLVELLKDKLSSIDSTKIIWMIQQRSTELQYEINKFQFKELQIDELSEQEIQIGIKENINRKGTSSYDQDCFNLNYSRLQELLSGLNQKLIDQQINLDCYQRLYKKFASTIPEAWLYSFVGVKELEKFCQLDQNFGNQEFLSEKRCKGISELQICIIDVEKIADNKRKAVSDNPNQRQEEEQENVELQQAEQRSERKDLCKKCFWFSVLLSILNTAPEFESQGAFQRLLVELPSQCEAISLEPEVVIKKWLDELNLKPETLVQSKQQINPTWFKLLQKVQKPQQIIDSEQTQSSKLTERQYDIDLTNQEDENSIQKQQLQKLKELSQIKPAKKQKKLSLKHMYHESFFFRILGLVDFYSSLALVSPSTLAFIQQIVDPHKLNILLQLLIGGLSQGKVLVLRIFQNLMRLDIPTEIFDRAIEISQKNVSDGSSNLLEDELSQLMSSNSGLDLSNTPLFKLLYTMILKIHETMWDPSKQEKSQGSYIFSIELARVFKQLSHSGLKNIFNQKIISSKIKDSLQKIETFSPPEIETIMSLVSESASNQLHVGAVCANKADQVFTVIGFFNQEYNKHTKSELNYRLEFDSELSQKLYIYGLYYDTSSPGRQEIICCKVNDIKFIRDVNGLDKLNRAQSSPFYSTDVVKHLIRILTGSAHCKSSFIQSQLRNYIVRGLENMVQILHSQYIQFLSGIGVSQEIFMCLIRNSSNKTDEIIRQKMTIKSSEIDIDQLRMLALTSPADSLREILSHRLYFGESQQYAFFTSLEDEINYNFSRLKIEKILGFTEKNLSFAKFLQIFACQHINVKLLSQKCFVPIASVSLLEPSMETYNILKVVQGVITDDSFSLPLFIEKIEDLIVQQPQYNPVAAIQFIIVSKGSLDEILSSVAEPRDSTESSKRPKSHLVQDQFTQEISRLVNQGSKLVSQYLKQLVNLGMMNQDQEQQADDSVHDIIKSKVIELHSKKPTALQSSEQQLKQTFQHSTQEREVVKDFEQANGKKETIEETNNESKDITQDQPEESKEERKTQMIDTTLTNKIRKNILPPNAKYPLPQEQLLEPDSEIQKSLRMTNHLQQYLTDALESQNQTLNETQPDQDRRPNYGGGYYDRQFPKIKFKPTRQPLKTLKTIHQAYKQDLEMLGNLQCRSTFFNMLAFGYKSYDQLQASQNFDMSQESLQKLQNLIYNEISASIIINDQNKDQEQLLKACKKRIKSTYKIFFNNQEFQKFVLQDIVSRGIETVKWLRNDEQVRNQKSQSVQKIREEKNLNTTQFSDPIALSFMADQLFKLGQINFNSTSQQLEDFIALFEIFLSFAIIFVVENESGPKILDQEPNQQAEKTSLIMLQTCVNIISTIQDNIRKVEFDATNEVLIGKILNNKLFKWVCSGLNLNQQLRLSKFQDFVIQIQTSLYHIQGIVKDQIGKRVEIAVQMNRFILASLKQRSIFEDGKSFNYLISSLQLKQILENESHARIAIVKENAQLYKTNLEMFQVPLSFQIQSRESPQKILFKNIAAGSNIQIKSLEGNNEIVNFSQQTLSKGMKSFILDQNQSVEMKVLLRSQLFMVGSPSQRKIHNDIDLETKVHNLNLEITQVVCGFKTTMLVCKDESLYAISSKDSPYQQSQHGYRNWDQEQSQQPAAWTELKKPAECIDYVKVVASNSCQLILTRSGQVFCQGQNLRQYIDKSLPPTQRPQINLGGPSLQNDFHLKANTFTHDFVNCTDVFPIEDGDQIMDVAAGFNYTVVVTEAGYAYAVGQDPSRGRPNLFTNASEQQAIKQSKSIHRLELPGRALKCWAHKMMSFAYIQVEDESDGSIQVYGGCEYEQIIRQQGDRACLIPTGRSLLDVVPNARNVREVAQNQVIHPQSSSISVSYRKLKFADTDDVVIKKIELNEITGFALDSVGVLWSWGYLQNEPPNQSYGQQMKLCSKQKQNCANKVDYFQNNGLRVLDFTVSKLYTIIEVEDNTKMRHMYVHYASNFESDGYHRTNRGLNSNIAQEFGDNHEVKVENFLYKLRLSNDEISQLIAFDSGTDFTMFLRNSLKDDAQLIGGKRIQTGRLTHLFKNENSEWSIVQEDEYETLKNQLPDLCLAVRYPITDFDLKADLLPDLSADSELLKIVGIEDESNIIPDQIKSSVNGQIISTEQPLYCSYSKINGQEQKLYLTEDQILNSADSTFVMNPLIFYRVQRPQTIDIRKLPMIHLPKFYEQSKKKQQNQSGVDEQQISFTVKKIDLSGQKNKDYLQAILANTNDNNEFAQKFEELKQFKKEDDRLLLRQIEKYFINHIKDKEINQVSCEDFDINKFELKNEHLSQMSQEVIKMRTYLFLKFTKQFMAASSSISYSGQKSSVGSISYYFLKNKSLALNSVKNNILEKELDKLIGQGTRYRGNPTIKINRNKASVFATDRKVDHDGSQTIFGQCFQTCKDQDSSYQMFRQKGSDPRCWMASFVGEGSVDAGGPFRDSLDNIVQELESDVLPLLIRTPNNRNDHGSNRDCYMINPSSRSPTHLEMFKFLGAFLSFSIISQSPIPIHLAPSVWKQLLNEELDMDDFESFDAYSSQILVNLRDHSSLLPYEQFIQEVDLKFTTVLSSGEEVNLKHGDEVEDVAPWNVEQYISLVMKTRFNESRKQIDSMREGIQLVFGQKIMPVLQIMDWDSIESRACGEKTIDIEKLKSITKYEGCNENSPLIKRYWRVMTAFDDELRQKYLKFVWGRSRLPINTKDLRSQHTITLCPQKDKNGFPHAHTCFFSIDLPDYPNDKIMRERLTTAITMCGEIDTDGTARTDFNGDNIA